nr:nitrate- and nitrite sensing domain-containing protein [Saccharopolyspora sp. HNM0983]
MDHSPADTTRAATRPRSRPGFITRFRQWQDWKLPAKITAVVLIPVLFALALGVHQIRSQIDRAAEFGELDRVVTAGSAVRAAVGELQQERSRTADFLSAETGTPAEIQRDFSAADTAITNLQHDLHRVPDAETLRFAHLETEDRVAGLGPLRDRILDRSVHADEAANGYTEIIGTLLSLDRSLISQMSEAQVVAEATTAHELALITEEVRLQQALVLTGLSHGEFTSDSQARLAASETRRSAAVNDFRAAATLQQRDRYDQLYAQPQLPERETSVQLAMNTAQQPQPAVQNVPPTAWQEQSDTTVRSLDALGRDLHERLESTAFRLEDRAGNIAGLESVVLFTTLLIAGIVAAVIVRQLLGSLHTLRRGALTAAHEQLPRAVADLRAGHDASTGVQRVPVHTRDEVGELARAFDEVHTQAIGLATEQAELRRSYGDSFINVSRRSQSLLERQLRLFEQLERDEEDPDQLATLFQLDHLATRMRRNNENLMVLSGTDPARRFTRPASPADLVRAAVSEIEHYPRVIVQPLPDNRIVGYAASDLVRLLAELLDNAANFSAPHTQVTVTGHLRGDGSLDIDITDHGIGMPQEELANANERLTADREIDLSTSRRMGLFVVGRLAARHDIRVTLSPGPEGTGVRATVCLARELLVDAPPDGGDPMRTNGNAAVPTDAPPAMRDDDTVVQEFDWEAAERDASSQRHLVRNGFHLLRPAQNEPEDPDAPDDARSEATDLFGFADSVAWAGTASAGTDDSATGADDGSSATSAEGAGQNGVVPVSGPSCFDAPPVSSNTPEDAETSFDDLASAWFQVSESTTPTHPHQPAWPTAEPDASKGTFLSPVEERFPSSQPPDSQIDWTFASDDEQQRADEISVASPVDFTDAGLPQRIPRAHLVQGSAVPTSGQAQRSTRDPDTARGRLASFQEGLRRGRHHHEASEYSETAQGDSSQVDWGFDSTPGEQRPEEVLDSDPEDYTTAGLPRRTPKAQLVPGSADGAESKPQRDADEMRGRLTSFQQGIREGKHSLRDATPSADFSPNE